MCAIVRGLTRYYSPLFLIGTLLSVPIYAEENHEQISSSEDGVEFNDQFLFNTDSSGKVDVSRFSHGNPVLPGVYSVVVYVNNAAKYNGKITFKANGTDIASPCITQLLLSQLGIDTSTIKFVAEEEDASSEQATCYDLSAIYSGSHVSFASEEQRLDISLPQIYVLKRPKGYIDPSLWDSGVNAAMLSYDLNAYTSNNDGDMAQSAYMGLNYGVNLGAWRFRSRGSANWSKDNGSGYESQDIYVQRDIPSLKSQFVIGDTFTSGDTFDSVSLRGIRLYSDTRMQPGGEESYVPVVRGVANSNAKVTVRQSGNTIYETTVPPGPFAIDDLNPSGSGSDLDVTVEEADGSKRSFSIPFSSVTQMLRPGTARWDFGLGELNDETPGNKPKVVVASGYYGINNLLTGYTGIEFTDTDYFAVLLGVAVNTSFGAIALDVTQSQADIETVGTLQGQSYRLTFSKLLEMTDTSFNVTAYRFSTTDYLSLSDASSLNNDIDSTNNADGNENSWNNFDRQKNQVQVSINQLLQAGDNNYGSVYLTGSWEDYWNNSKTTSQYSFGYSNSFSWVSYNLSLQRAYNVNGEEDDRAYIGLSIPFGNLPGHDIRKGGFNNMNASISSDFKGNSQADVSASGNSADNRYNYSVNASSTLSESQDLTQIGGYGSYNSAYGPISVSASINDHSGQQASFGNSGGVVIHSGGITFSPGNIGTTSTIALVKAKGAKGAKMTNGDGEIDGQGYAVVPYLSPYRENTIGLNIDTLENDVAIMNTSTTAIPRDGAVVRVDFATEEGRSVLLELIRNDKGFIPLGADVYDENNNVVGSVGQAGRAFVRGINDAGRLTIRWGNKSEEQCTVNYQIPANAQTIGLTTVLTNQSCHVN